MRDALAAVHARLPACIERFGGHAMAAGLSLRLDQLDAFRAAFTGHASRMLTPELLQLDVLTDGPLGADEFTRAHAVGLRDGGPWGQAFPEPQFDGEFDVVRWRVIKDRHLKLELRDGPVCVDAIQFNGWTGTAPPSRVRVAYRLEPDDYRGGDAVQLVVVHREPA